MRDLFTRPLDEIATIDLDAILDRYAGVVDAATKAALDQLIVDLKQSVVDLENELARRSGVSGLTEKAGRGKS